MPKKEKDPAVLQTKLVTPEEAKVLQRFPYASKLTIEDPELLIRECEKEIEYIDSIRTEQDLVNKWQKARDQYAGVTEYTDFPWENSSNLFIHITSMAVDVLNTKAQSQMFVSPMMMLRPLPGQTGENLYEDISLKEKYLDYKAQEEIEIEEKLDPILQDAINLGTGIAKVQYIKKIDYNAVVSEMYESTAEDILQFKVDFKKDKGSSEYNRILKDLVGHGKEEEPNGIPAEVWMHSDEVTYNNPEVSYVKLDDLHVRPDIDNIDNQRVIGEDVEFTWTDICNHVNTGYFQEKKY